MERPRKKRRKCARKDASSAKKKSLKATPVIEYSGYKVEDGVKVLDRVPSTVSAEEFYAKYVRARRPCIIFDATKAPGSSTSTSSSSSEPGPLLASKWTDAHLASKAGKTKIKAEFRDDASQGFGRGREREMLFLDFLEAIRGAPVEKTEGAAAGAPGGLEHVASELLYLTTQPLPAGPEGRPAVTAPPLDQLLDEFELRPRLAGGLVPFNANIWMGRSANGTCEHRVSGRERMLGSRNTYI